MSESERLRVGEAKRLAATWVAEETSGLPGFRGAYFAGSARWLADYAELPVTSDIDVSVVFSDAGTAPRQGKFAYRGVLLDVASRSLAELQSPAQVLSHYHLAGAFRGSGVILDPSGHLRALEAAVTRDFARREWVRRRCAHARGRIVEQLDALNAAEPFHTQVIGWVFPTGVTTHVLLVAGLQNPTVRQRYVAVRALLAKYGHSDVYAQLLGLLGCADMSRARVERHLGPLTEVFQATSTVIRSPFAFAGDLGAAARTVAIDGSRELIERGLHREAVFWMVVSYSRCQVVLAADAPPAMQRQFEAGYRELLADLGITSFADLRQRREQVQGFLPRLDEVAEAIVAANPDIVA